MLDTKHRVIRGKAVSIVSLDATVVHPGEVFREAVAASSLGIVLFHNHPSSDPSPSADDLVLTGRMVRAGEIMGIDDVILDDQRHRGLRAGRIRLSGRETAVSRLLLRCGGRHVPRRTD
jgi:DNA repair protein RadC